MPINLSVCGGTDVGLARRTNEDAFVIADLAGEERTQGDVRVQDGAIKRFEIGKRGVLLAVSDGVGGQDAGEVASALVVECLRRTMATSTGSRPGEAMVEKAVKIANEEVWQASHAPGRRNMGATLTAMFVQGSTAHFAEVGDSRAYLLRSGELMQVTRDQSYVQLLVDSGLMRPEDAQNAPLKNVILQAMGQKPDVQVALGRLELRQRDCFLLCSDGLTNEISETEMRDTILGSPRLDVACKRLIDLAKAHGGHDNITVIIGGVSGDLQAAAPGERIADTLEILKEFEGPVSRSA